MTNPHAEALREASAHTGERWIQHAMAKAADELDRLTALLAARDAKAATDGERMAGMERTQVLCTECCGAGYVINIAGFGTATTRCDHCTGGLRPLSAQLAGGTP